MAASSASPAGSTLPAPRSVTVIGAGIVGVATALCLQRDGHRVAILDPREPGDGTSSGSAGIIATSEVAPLAMPGIARELPRMLRDRYRDRRVRPTYLPWIAPWLARLAAAARPARVEAISGALAALLEAADPAYAALLQGTVAQSLYRRTGWLKVYAGEAKFDASAPERDLMRWRGVRFDILNGAEIREIEPALAPRFVRGIFFPDCGQVLSSKRLVTALAQAFLAEGGAIHREAARGFALGEGQHRILTDGGTHASEAIVLAAGAWSRPLAQRLGARVPLDAERGYQLTFALPEAGLRRPVQSGEDCFTLIPIEEGVQLGGGSEFAGLKAPPDWRPIERLARRARAFLPDLPAEPATRWLGMRPTLPDSLPVLGASARHRGVYFAFGHQHLGVTLAAISGRIVADLVAGRDPGIDLAPYRAERW